MGGRVCCSWWLRSLRPRRISLAVSMSPVHLIAELYAADRETMMAILESPEGRAARDDLKNSVVGGVDFLYGDEAKATVS